MFDAKANLFHIPLGVYPQNDKQQYRRGKADVKYKLMGVFNFSCGKSLSENRFVTSVMDYCNSYEGYGSDEISQIIKNVRFEIRKHGLNEDYLAKIFAVVRYQAKLTLGMEHYPHQILGARAMIKGLVIEMDTGEGKSLCATLAVASSALFGVPAHVITVNEYLAQRDVASFEPLYQSLGLSVSSVNEDMSDEEKRKAYTSDIVYCTNKQVVFDYLRDCLVLGKGYGAVGLQTESLYIKNSRDQRLLLPGLSFAVVDEADSVLIDEATTPLIISKTINSTQKQAFYKKALQLSMNLDEGIDYLTMAKTKSIHFTVSGDKKLTVFGAKIGGLWVGSCPRNELVAQALKARHFFLLGSSYIVCDGKVTIIDEFTGRTMADRSWESGLHQMIELKEGCEMTGERETLAQISYQKFFQRYVNVAGMTGTISEVKREINDVYGLSVYRVKRRFPLKTIFQCLTFFNTKQDKWNAVALRVKTLHQNGHACLIGTKSVSDSQILHQKLLGMAVPHSLLNAENPEGEAEIIAKAGAGGCVTIATNMAGRGTDIKICDQVKKLGGLMIIATELHDSSRIDRQLYGRCGRQGDPGRVEVFLSMKDDLFINETPRWIQVALNLLFKYSNPLAQWASAFCFRVCQRNMERRQFNIRKSVLMHDVAQGKLLAFSGGVE